MNFFSAEPLLWYLIAVFIVVEFLALAFFYRLKNSTRDRRREGAEQSPAIALKSLGREAVLGEIERLRAGGEIDEKFIRLMSAEDKALFEIALIDALTKWPREDQHRLRSTLIKNGYDERCAQRLMRGEISNRVRASTLLNLLRPQSQARPSEPDSFMKTKRGRLVPLVSKEMEK